MQKFEKPQMELVCFGNDDIITSSLVSVDSLMDVGTDGLKDSSAPVSRVGESYLHF